MQTSRHFGFLLLAVNFAFAVALCGQQTAPTGAIVGRVFNPASGEYVRNAEIVVVGTPRSAVSTDGGFFTLPNVPAGEVTLKVNYTGYEATPARLRVEAGGTARQDFELVSTDPRPGPGAVLKLQDFVVSADREGNAKAIMDQRRSMNVANVVASDVFGNIHEDNPGEFLKYLPGVDIEWSADQPRAIRIQGMDPQYTAVTVDGERVPSGDAYVQFLGTTNTEAGDSSRQVNLTDISLASIESVEVFKSNSPDLDADAPAGTVNMRMRRAFDRKGRLITWQVSAIANSTEMHLNRVYGLDDERHRRVKPGASLSYSDVFLNQRLGIIATLSQSTSFSQEQRMIPRVSTTTQAGDSRPIVINQLGFQDNPRTSERGSAAATLDFKATPHLALTLRAQYNYSEFRSFNHTLNFQFAANDNSANGRSTVRGDGVTVLETGGSTAATRLLSNNSGRGFQKLGDSYSVSPAFEYKRGPLIVDGRFSYSNSISKIRGIEAGYISGFTQGNLTNINFRAERSSPTSFDWVIRQTSGPDWNNLFNYKNPGIGDEYRNGKHQIFTGTANAKYDLPLRFPAWLKVGAKVNEQVRDYISLFDYLKWSYTGPGGGANGSFGDPAAPANFLSSAVSKHPFGKFYGLTSGLAPAYPSRPAITDAFKAHPEWFTPTGTPAQWLASYIRSNKDYKEQVNAAYGMAYTKIGNLRLQGGLRWEGTRTASLEYDPRSLAEVRAAGFPVSGGESTTIPGMDYRYRSQPRVLRSGDYDSWFPSLSGKYDLRRNLVAHFGYNRAIQRPGFNHVSGVWAVNEDVLRVDVPNPGLKPEKTEKYVARLETYFEPVGNFGVGAFYTKIDNMRELHDFTADEFGVDDPFFSGYTFRTQTSGTESRNVKGYEVDYRQQLRFLPGFLKGTGIYANYTRTLTSTRSSGVAPHHIKGGLNFRYRRLGLGANVAWYPDTPRAAVNQYRREYYSLAVNADFRLTPRVSLFLIGKNVTNETEVEAQMAPGGIDFDRQYSHYGSIWTLGVKGTF